MDCQLFASSEGLNGKANRDCQARIVVGDGKFRVMQLCDCRSQRKAEPRARQRATMFDALETLHYIGVFSRRNTRTVVGNDRNSGDQFSTKFDCDQRVRWRVNQRVFN